MASSLTTRVLRRLRPSAPMVVAVVALFVALGGPAQAAKLLSGKDIKNRSLTTRDLSKKTVKTLRSTPRGSVKTRALANGAVTSGKLHDAAVTTGKIAPGSITMTQMAANAIGPRELVTGGVTNPAVADGAITGAKVADGSLDTRDLARFSGRFRVAKSDIRDVGPSEGIIDPHKCWSGRPRGLPAELVGADISQDLVVATPDGAWPQDQLAFTVKNDANSASLFVLAACNVTDSPVTWPDTVGFRYMVVDLP